MFSFLQFIGFSFVILGMYLEFKYKAHDLGSENFLEILEKEAKLPIISDLDIMDVFEINSIKGSKEEPQIPFSSIEAFEVISLYKDGEYSLERACEILDMKKGEVLLLENLFEKYQE